MSETNEAPIRKVIYQQESFEIVEIEWTDRSYTQAHDHGWSQCIVEILEGRFENFLDTQFKIEKQVFEKGMTMVSPVGADHHLRCISKKGKTLHVYVPKIVSLEQRSLVLSKNKNESLKETVNLENHVDFGVLQKSLETIESSCLSTWSQRFMNQLFSGISPYALMTDAIVSRTRTTLAILESSPIYSEIENEIVRSINKLIGFSEGSSGIGVPGGSAANIMALHLAMVNINPDYVKTGHNGDRYQIFVSDQAHYSFKKAALALGLGKNSIIQVQSDSSSRMCVEDLELKIKSCRQSGAIPLMVVATAGTTVAGAFDPIRQIQKICQKNNLWLHVDAAWGGSVLFSRNSRHLLDGIELCDSMTFDAHKLLGSTLTCAYLLVRDKNILVQANDVDGAGYLFHSEEDLDIGKKSWQCGRGMSSLSFWAMWKHLGTEGIGDFVDRMIDLKSQFVDWLKTKKEIQLVNTNPEYLNVCFRIVKDDRFVSIIPRREHLKNQNKFLVNYFTDHESSYYRFILAHPKLDFAFLKEMVELVVNDGG